MQTVDSSTLAFFGVAAGVVMCFGTLSDYNSTMWLAASLSLIISGIVLGRNASHPALLLPIGLYWLTVSSDILGADLLGVSTGELEGRAYRTEAIITSFVALPALALGMRVGVKRGIRVAPFVIFTGGSTIPNRILPFRKALYLYLASSAASSMLMYLGGTVSGLAQPTIALAQIKYVGLFLFCVAALERRRYVALAVVSFAEILIGMTGFIASFQPSLITILAAMLIVSRRNPRWSDVLGLAVAGCVLLWTCLVWTAMKPDYRAWIASGTDGLSLSDRFSWISQWYMGDSLDYGAAALKLVDRLGYTKFYGLALQRADLNLLPDDVSFWTAAVLRILMPRVLFPDKSAINDSIVTTALTGMNFSDATSVSVGWVAQAHIEFGFPGMLFPIFGLGFLLGWALSFIRAKGARTIWAEALGVALVAPSFFYEANIDKSLGSFMSRFIGAFLILRYALPPMTRWLNTKYLHSVRSDNNVV